VSKLTDTFEVIAKTLGLLFVDMVN